MFSYKIVETPKGPHVQILYGDNVIDESGPWESLVSVINWAESYVNLKNSGIEEPVF
jgi:hypothetical protein